MLIERAPNLKFRISENLKNLDSGKIGIDLDNVIQATDVKALPNAGRFVGRSISKDEIESFWELIEIVKQRGLSHEESTEIAKGAWNNISVYLESPLESGAESLLKILHDLEIPHVFISSRPEIFMNATKEFFSQKFPWIDPATINLGGNKNRVVTRENVRLHIDDSSEEAELIVNKTPAKVLLLAQPWNVNNIPDNDKIKFVGPYTQYSGVWPVLRFLASPDAAEFIKND